MRTSRLRERQQREDEQKRVEIARRQEARAFRNAVTATMEAIGETGNQPKQIVERLITHLGTEATQAFIQETEQIEAQGGMLLPDGSRRRTKGGVFFFLVKQQLQKEDRKADIKTIFGK